MKNPLKVLVFTISAQCSCNCIQINKFRQKPSEYTEIEHFFTPYVPYAQLHGNRMYSTASEAFCADSQTRTTTLFMNVHCDHLPVWQMKCVGPGPAAQCVKNQHFDSAAAAQMGSQWKVWAPVSTVLLRVVGVWLILWACVHICAPGMCTALELKDKG